jgi:hypothetical protein
LLFGHFHRGGSVHRAWFVCEIRGGGRGRVRRFPRGFR